MRENGGIEQRLLVAFADMSLLSRTFVLLGGYEVPLGSPLVLDIYTALCAAESSGRIVHHTRAEAEADDEHFDGNTTERGN